MIFAVRDDRGLSRARILALIAILFVMLMILSFVTSRHSNAPAKPADAKTTSSSSAGSTQKATLTLSPAVQAQVSSVTNSAVGGALGYVKQTGSTGQGEIDAVKNYVTPDLYASLTQGAADGIGFDPILCTQEVPTTVTSKLLSNSGGQATLQINERFSDRTSQFNVVVDLQSKKLTSISCPRT